MTLLERGFDLDDSCKLYLPFFRQKSSSAYIYDQSGNGNHATITGAVPTTLANPPIGWYCDGTNDLFTITDFLCTGNSGQEITVLQWIYPHLFAADDRTICHLDIGTNQRAWRLGIMDANGKYAVGISDDGTAAAGHQKNYTSSVNMTASKFNLIGFTFNAGTLSLYLNGSVDTNPTKTTDDAITTIHNSTANLTIGCSLNNGVGGNFSNITTGEAWIFCEVLTPLRIRNMYEITRRKYGV